MTQVDDLQDTVNAELPIRIVLLTVAQVEFDGDPNDGGAPDILKNSPDGTYYLQETPETLWRKTTVGTSWTLSEPGAAIKVSTAEDLVFPLDYNDGSAVDASASTVFTSQQEIDDFLTSQSATNFKHLQRLHDNLPVLVSHIATVNAAAGIHRPDPLDSAARAGWALENKIFLESGVIIVQGESPASYTSLSGPHTINTHTVNIDPKLNVLGTPFVAGAFKGMYAVLSTGQTCLIHDNDTSSVSLVNQLSPAPTDTVSTFSIKKPATVFRNSLDDSTDTNLHDVGFLQAGDVCLKDAVIEGWIPGGGATFGTDWFIEEPPSDTSVTNERVIMDSGAYHTAHGTDPSQNNGFSATSKVRGAIVNISDCSFLGPPKSATENLAFIMSVSGGCSLNGFGPAFASGTYIFGSRTGVFVGERSIISLPSSVWDSLGSTTNGTTFFKGVISVGKDGGFFTSWFSGKRPEMRDFQRRTSNTDLSCISLEGDGAVTGSSVNRLKFTNNATSGVFVGDGGRVVGGNFEDGGGNTQYGWVVAGPRSVVELAASDDVTGTLGDVKFEDVVGVYADLPLPTAPLNTNLGNQISKAV